jgi:hypothetical protein
VVVDVDVDVDVDVVVDVDGDGDGDVAVNESRYSFLSIEPLKVNIESVHPPLTRWP